MTTELKLTDKSQEILSKLPEVHRQSAVNYAISMLPSTDFYKQAKFVTKSMDDIDVQADVSTNTPKINNNNNNNNNNTDSIAW